MEVFIDFDVGNVTVDGLFKIKVDSSIMNNDGVGEEKGNLTMVQLQNGNTWARNLETTNYNFSGKPIIPAAISIMELSVNSDRQTELKVNYINHSMNRDIYLNNDRLPGKSF